MPISIQQYRPEHENAVREFNRRLQAGGAESNLVFYENAHPKWLPQNQNASLYNEFFLALDGEVVRGGYALKHQDFSFADGTVRFIKSTIARDVLGALLTRNGHEKVAPHSY